ncbi:precorrin-6Y methyltransferase [Pseudorhodoferax aquiterrae]|uniref:Precorrin-6Y methyltransferase n=1 Tax=Pseudorhodoferax aquiterrae TaxID=747304 RepID=A0ABQ3GCI9_9BURK|nr:precorrin-6y C5,15-methyltransferase (decarboxylating) subunit CbiE [Pseudorhodoferax aquiterrae]GHC99373.1 precorrin-6Y methyltransferase [Pseudorhodoferax aquiterrae]
MAERWLDIIGIGEDGLAGLSGAARAALDQATHIVGGPRHLALAQAGARGQAWPRPFDPAPVLALRGQRVAVLASGDPFWFGAGGTLATQLAPGEWTAHPAPSTFSRAAARLGWRLEAVTCLGLHARPFAAARPHLHPGARLLCLLASAEAVGAFAQWLCDQGFGRSTLWVLEALGGPRERVRQAQAQDFDLPGIAAPVAVALEPAGAPGLPRAAGLPDAAFAHDGQITKSPMRALTLSALAPRPGELLWDVGAGSGSVAIEWCLAGGHACAVEQHAARAANIQANAVQFGVAERLQVLVGRAPQALAGLEPAQAVFVGGGFGPALFEALRAASPGARLVTNAVTLETEALLLQLQARHGGTLLRIDIAQAAPLGRLRGWAPSRPIVQWSVPL